MKIQEGHDTYAIIRTVLLVFGHQGLQHPNSPECTGNRELHLHPIQAYKDGIPQATSYIHIFAVVQGSQFC